MTEEEKRLRKIKVVDALLSGACNPNSLPSENTYNPKDLTDNEKYHISRRINVKGTEELLLDMCASGDKDSKTEQLINEAEYSKQKYIKGLLEAAKLKETSSEEPLKPMKLTLNTNEEDYYE